MIIPPRFLGDSWSIFFLVMQSDAFSDVFPVFPLLYAAVFPLFPLLCTWPWSWLPAFEVWVTGVLVVWILEPLGYEIDLLRRLAALRVLRLGRLARAVRIMPMFHEFLGAGHWNSVDL